VLLLVLKSDECESYHQKVIKEENLPLVHPGPLRPVGVRDLIELATAHQPTMGEGQHLYREIQYK